MLMVELLGVALAQNESAYPELAERGDMIRRVLSIEEERFNATIDAGLSMLERILEQMAEEDKTTLDGAEAFKLYDTYGFPYDLTLEIAQERGCEVDEATFRSLMNEQRTRARQARGNVGGWDESSKSAISGLEKTEFCGYCELECDATVVAILAEGDNGAYSVNEINEGDFTLVLDKTPFYGEGGGQVGDTGFATVNGVKVNVVDTKKSEGKYQHICELSDNAVVKVGNTVTLTVDAERREAIKRNHSSVHLLQAALRKVLGDHVEQAGSYVNESVCRFDFTHFAALTAEEIAAVEALVNTHILAAEGITTLETDIETARQNGAMALFGEKYGKIVRMVKMGDFSTELCGGTHCTNTGNIGLFKIVSEASVAAGVRRIEAVTGQGVLQLLAQKDALIAETAKELKAANTADLAKRASQLQNELKEERRQIESLNAKIASTKLDALRSSAKAVGSVSLITADMGAMSMDAARSLCDTLKETPDAVGVIAIHEGEKLNFLAVCGADAVKAGAHAGNIVREVAKVAGGSGGGKPDSAMAGGKDVSKVDDALTAAADIVKGMLK